MTGKGRKSAQWTQFAKRNKQKAVGYKLGQKIKTIKNFLSFLTKHGIYMS